MVFSLSCEAVLDISADGFDSEFSFSSSPIGLFLEDFGDFDIILVRLSIDQQIDISTDAFDPDLFASEHIRFEIGTDKISLETIQDTHITDLDIAVDAVDLISFKGTVIETHITIDPIDTQSSGLDLFKFEISVDRLNVQIEFTVFRYGDDRFVIAEDLFSIVREQF